MRKTLALLLAAAFLYLAASPPLSIKSQTLVASAKFHTVANPIPNRYIVVLATTDLSPDRRSGPNTFSSNTKSAQSSADSARLLPSRVWHPCVAEPAPADPEWLRQPRS